MRMMCFAKRTAKEILRDPINIIFGLGFEVVILLLLSVIQKNVPVSLFEIDYLAPAISVFGLSFTTLFSAMLISKDRQNELMARLCTTPMTSADFILGYTLPIIPMAVAQTAVCYITGVILGMKLTVNMLASIAVTIPISVFFIAFGLLCGSIFNDKQVGEICGALFTNLTAWLSGAWFDLKLVGGAFESIAKALPFVHAVDLQRSIIAGNYNVILSDALWVIGYCIVSVIIAVVVFTAKMNRDN